VLTCNIVLAELPKRGGGIFRKRFDFSSIFSRLGKFVFDHILVIKLTIMLTIKKNIQVMVSLPCIAPIPKPVNLGLSFLIPLTYYPNQSIPFSRKPIYFHTITPLLTHRCMLDMLVGHLDSKTKQCVCSCAFYTRNT